VVGRWHVSSAALLDTPKYGAGPVRVEPLLNCRSISSKHINPSPLARTSRTCASRSEKRRRADDLYKTDRLGSGHVWFHRGIQIWIWKLAHSPEASRSTSTTTHIDAISFVTLFSSSSFIRTEGVCQTIDHIYLQATSARRSAFLWFHIYLRKSNR
jgi:hypothetical protein